MTPGQARIALLSFLIVTTGVAVNALFLQTKSSGATRAVVERPTVTGPTGAGRKKGEAARGDRAGARWPGSSSTDSPLRIARFAPDSARLDIIPDASQDTASSRSIAAIQRELNARGYGPLASDGVIGIGTRAAIMAFEHDHGLTLTGEASEALLERILFGGAAGLEPASAPKSRSSEAEQVIRTVQKGLVALGYQVGRADGRLGEDTVKAIRDFEVDKGLVPKGRISAELLAHLSEAATPRPASR